MSVVIEVKSGSVQAVYTNTESTIFLIDHDTDDGMIQIIPKPIGSCLAEDINKFPLSKK